jgi:hypothetical protein
MLSQWCDDEKNVMKYITNSCYLVSGLYIMREARGIRFLFTKWNGETSYREKSGIKGYAYSGAKGGFEKCT